MTDRPSDTSRLSPWKILNSKTLYEDPWVKFRSDRCQIHSGRIIESYHILEYRDWTNVVAITEDLKIILVREYRHGSKEIVLGLPSGYLDPEDSSAEAGAKRELKEETGYESQIWIPLKPCSPNPATHTNLCRPFLALNVKDSNVRKLDENEEIEVVIQDFAEFMHSLRTGKFNFQALHLASIFEVYALVKSSKRPELESLRAALL